MRKIYLVILILLSYAAYSQEKKVDGAQKPPAIFALSVNGKEYSITEGQELKLDGNLNNPTISVKMATYRKFDNGTISFNYKSNSTYQYEESPGSKTWTFDGSDCVVFLFELEGKVKLDAIVDQVVGQFGKKNCRIETINKRIGDKTINGKQINVTVVGQKLVQEYYEIVLNDSKTYILAFQNSKKDDGSISEDGKAGVELVATTVKF